MISKPEKKIHKQKLYSHLNCGSSSCMRVAEILQNDRVKIKIMQHLHSINMENGFTAYKNAIVLSRLALFSINIGRYFCQPIFEPLRSARVFAYFRNWIKQFVKQTNKQTAEVKQATKTNRICHFLFSHFHCISVFLWVFSGSRKSISLKPDAHTEH